MRPLPLEAAMSFLDDLKRKATELQATRSVDPNLIGGLVLQAGSMRLDASLRGSLDRLRQQLATTRSQAG